ncbi:MAG: hypothetical protein R2877_07455 [Bdellovibrionota bacterium]
MEMLTNPVTYTLALTLAIISSLETLLNIDGADKLDPQKRITSRNERTIRARHGQHHQRIARWLAGDFSGRSHHGQRSSSARSKIHHLSRLFPYLEYFFMAAWMNLIPLSALAAILIVFGFQIGTPKNLQEILQQRTRSVLAIHDHHRCDSIHQFAGG